MLTDLKYKQYFDLTIIFVCFFSIIFKSDKSSDKYGLTLCWIDL